jgi:hypothetical protein
MDIKNIKSKISCWGQESNTNNIKKIKNDSEPEKKMPKQLKPDYFKKLEKDYTSLNLVSRKNIYFNIHHNRI